jgi:hypothetical protein
MGSAGGLNRGRQSSKPRLPARESHGDLCNLAIAVHASLFERLNPLARLLRNEAMTHSAAILNAISPETPIRS